MRVYDGWHKIDLIEAEIKGKKVKRELLVLPSAVGGLVIDTEGRVGLVRQYRPTIQRDCWEIPAGVLDKPLLTPLETLLEELQEECGITQKDVLEVVSEPLCKYFMVTGSSDATMSIYLIKVTEQTDKKVDDSDVDEVKWFTQDEIAELVATGQIIDSKTLLASNFIKTITLT